MKSNWNRPFGYKHVLNVSLPLVASMASTTVMQFTDRMFLADYSTDAIAAALPGFIAAFLFQSFFMGVVGYVNVFVAQYTGAGAPHRVGASLWQGLAFTALAWVVMIAIAPLASPLFALAGHPVQVQELEIVYFQTLCMGSGLALTGMTLSCFFSGRGITRPVMIANVAGAAINIPLDWCLINGYGPFPELGIFGAGLATCLGWLITAVIMGLLIFTAENDRQFHVLKGKTLDRKLFSRLMRFGLPGGIQFFIDMFAVTFFIFAVGRLGRTELAASNIVMTMHSLAFLPMVGMHIAVETLVGQAIGQERPDRAVRATMSALKICYIYTLVVVALFVLLPDPLINLFVSRWDTTATFAPVLDMGRGLLRLMAIYCAIDAPALIFFGTLKGAGDMRFVMLTMLFSSLGVLVAPVIVMHNTSGMSLYGLWVLLGVYIIAIGSAAALRFVRGAWKSKRVIEIPAQG